MIGIHNTTTWLKNGRLKGLFILTWTRRKHVVLPHFLFLPMWALVQHCSPFLFKYICSALECTNSELYYDMNNHANFQTWNNNVFQASISSKIIVSNPNILHTGIPCWKIENR
uniref:Uncharacterized protein n=1 Tax=Aegilops tauschii subsp. strangulata TaxID=200361 RepID=A0A452YJN2_AEGTS